METKAYYSPHDIVTLQDIGFTTSQATSIVSVLSYVDETNMNFQLQYLQHHGVDMVTASYIMTKVFYYDHVASDQMLPRNFNPQQKAKFDEVISKVRYQIATMKLMATA